MIIKFNTIKPSWRHANLPKKTKFKANFDTFSRTSKVFILCRNRCLGYLNLEKSLFRLPTKRPRFKF